MSELLKLDHSSITNVLFHPRKDLYVELNNSKNLLIPVDDGIKIGSRLHLFKKEYPNLIYFHGNAELVSEHDQFSKIYKNLEVNFIPVDYRGYGFSNGTPSFSTMIMDANSIFRYLQIWLYENEYSGPVFLMGRSIGSASVLEIVQNFHDNVAGLIIESGFAYIEPLFKLFGIQYSKLGINLENTINHINKIKQFFGRLLIIHAKQDQIINFNEGVDLFKNSNSDEKSNYWVENAHHNNIIQVLGYNYFSLIKKFIYKGSL